MKGLFQCPPRVTPWVNTDANKSPCKGKNFKYQVIYKAFASTGRPFVLYPMQLVTPSVVAIAVSMLMAI